MSHLAILARAWQRPSLAVLLVTAAAGQWIRSPELVATAHAIDRAGFALINGAANQAWEVMRVEEQARKRRRSDD
ncbi:MAG: hypothetical protein KYX69_00150 [Sphingomonas sp.]|uniref:hypothetical protein n=1 Tax=Sphingomonas sp. TaxID=28214 RepID=UPI002603F928|nr:hypothetical protein [Sphingomonas sp.]MDK2766104.1 hypothetical protein [Sphingomonas sp.]